METKTIQLEIPEYLTIRQYQLLPDYDQEDSALKRHIDTVSAITGIDPQEIAYWDISSLKKVYDLIKDLGEPKNEFHSLIEFNGVLYGYDNIKQQNLGEYIDLENLCKDTKNNLHKIAAILYRPVTEHRFDSIDFIIKQKVKTLRHKDVANVFDYYEIEKYDSKVRKKREIEFEHFPLHVVLGAVSFFLTNAMQYLNNTQYSKILPEKMIQQTNQVIVENLLASIGAGGGLFTHSLKPIYYQYQGINQ